MIVLYVLIPSFMLLEALRWFWGSQSASKQAWHWADSLRFSLVFVFCILGFSHFSPLKYDMLAMLPAPVPQHISVIYITGILEVLGALGVVLIRTRLLACYCLILMLILLFPANIYAAINDIPFNGRPATPLIIRAPIQLLLICSITAVVMYERHRHKPTSNPYSD